MKVMKRIFSLIFILTLGLSIAGCSKDNKVIILNPVSQDDVLVGVLAHECRHAGQFERGEYDGSEWWKYKTFPNIENLKYIDNPIKIIDKYGGSFGELTGAIPGSKDDR